MHAAALRVDLRIPTSHSLKEKRAVLKAVISMLRTKFEVAVSETGHQNVWQRSTLGVAAVSASAGHLDAILDNVERAVREWPEIEVLHTAVTYLEDPQS